MSTSERSKPKSKQNETNKGDIRTELPITGESETPIRDRIVVEQERYAKAKLALQICQTLGILLVAFSIYVSWRSLQEQQRGVNDQHEWNRRQYTIELLSRFNAELKDHRAPVMDAFPGLYFQDNSGPPTRDQCRRIRQAKKGDFSIRGVDAFELRNHIVSVFNYFENLALAWESQTGNRDAIKDSVSLVILRWHDFFHNFILEVNEEMKGDPWPPLTRVVGTWKAEGEPKAKSIPKTGSESE